ncbi:amidohydrolase family protein [SAR202 cluster bacterium AD-804-J14_MRT_500m]|nr:amidohydrolase family protein [SAR202 cluster bacterium AD-804-J14_MRT_500m]
MSSSMVRGKYVISHVVDKDQSVVINDGAVFQVDGEIIDVGEFGKLRSKYDPDEIIGSEKEMVIPGLINAHHHVGLTPFQLGNKDLPLETWGATRGSTRDVDPYLDTLYCAIQMIESGITTVMHNHGLNRLPENLTLHELGFEVLKAYQDSGMRVAFSFGIRDQNQVVYHDDQEFLSTLPSDLAKMIKEGLERSRLSAGDYHSLVTDMRRKFGDNAPDQRIMHFFSPTNVQWCSDEMLLQIKEFASKIGTGIHIHLHETIYQKMYGYRYYGKTPLAHLHDLGFTGNEVSCAHGVWLTDNDIGLLAETGTMVCHNASSNLRLQSGVMPLNGLLAQDVTVAIGIDEAGINDDNDMLQEMRLVQKIHRVPGISSSSPTSHQVLHMATVNGAKATFFEDRVGTLEPGKRADLVLLDLEHITEPYLDPDTSPVDALLYRGKGQGVNTVIVDGEVLLRNRQLTRVNKDEVWAELKSRLSKDLEPYEVKRKHVARRLVPYIQQFYEKWPMDRVKPHYYFNESQ